MIDASQADAALRFCTVQQGVAAGGQTPPVPLSIDNVGGNDPSRAYHFTVGSDHKIYGLNDPLPPGPSFPMTMTLRVMQGVIAVHSKIFRPDELGGTRWDSGSSIVHADLPFDQGKGFGSEWRNEHRFSQFVPQEGDYVSAVRANIVNLQTRGFLYQFSIPDEKTPAPGAASVAIDPIDTGDAELAERSPFLGIPGNRLGCAAALAGLGSLGVLIGVILAYAYWGPSDSGPDTTPDAVYNAGQNSGVDTQPKPSPVLTGFPGTKALFDRLGFDDASERKLEANMITLPPHGLFYSDSTKQPGLDVNWLKIKAYTGGYVDMTAPWADTLNQRFPCGKVVDGARTTCADGVSGFTPMDYWIGGTILFDKIPENEPSISSTFAFVAADPAAGNNYRASLPFDKDLYGQTKYWYELTHTTAGNQWHLQLRIYPQVASPAQTGAIVINSGDTVFWAIPEKELPKGDLHFNVTTFGYTALPPDPATAAVDALSDPRKPLPIAPMTLVFAGNASGYPTDTPSDGGATTTTAAFQTYLSEFADKFRVRDNTYLFDHLDPAVLQVYGAVQCRSSLAPRKADPSFKIDVLRVSGPAPFQYQAEGRTIAVERTYTVVSNVTDATGTVERTQHFTYDNGKLTWFTTCTATSQ